MALIIRKFVLQPFYNNTYLVVDANTNQAVVIDPATGSKIISEIAVENGYTIINIWLTHAHFDHFCGVSEITNGNGINPSIALHSHDLDLWRRDGDAQEFDYIFERGPEPSLILKDGQTLQLGESEIQVIHTPGHCKGHVVYLSRSDNVLFCGDLIFKGGIGRTDLQGGSMSEILDSIFNKILILPEETRLLPGHGPETSILEAKLMDI